MHYYPHHIGDFIKDTANLNDHQMVTYLRMIWAYYTEEKPLPDECESIAFAMRSDEKTVHLLLRHYFDLQADGWHHKRCDRVLQDIYGKSEKARDAANKRWGKEKQKMPDQCDGNADAMQTHNANNADASLLDATQYPIPKEREGCVDEQASPAPPPPEKKTKVSRAVSLSSDWEPTQEMIDYCKAKRPELNPNVVAENFRDYFLSAPGDKGLKKDWEATWRTWVRRESPQHSMFGHGRNVHLSSTDDALARAK
jgi:uncharacterized protein YdaU (DUF1376 family)